MTVSRAIEQRVQLAVQKAREEEQKKMQKEQMKMLAENFMRCSVSYSKAMSP
ncbi:MAG: hypothetical protein ACI4NM_05645 [Bullifex sp.]